MTVRSNPPGAMLYVDDQQIGVTPVATDFVYYGTRKFKLVKNGYETMTTYQKIEAPWYQVPPLDFFSENVNPREIRDERVINFQLRPKRIVPTAELLSRAGNLRNSSIQGFVVPPIHSDETAFSPEAPIHPGANPMIDPAMNQPTLP